MVQTQKNAIIVFAGDSITDGNHVSGMDCNHIFGHGYQTLVAGCLGADNLSRGLRFVNVGHSGFTLQDIYSHWEEDVLVFRPDVLSILAGINDAQAGYEKGITKETVLKQYAEVYEKLLAQTYTTLPNCQVVLMEPFFLPTKISDPLDEVPHPRYGDPVNLYKRKRNQTEYLQQTVLGLSDIVRTVAKRHNCIYVAVADELEKASEKSTEPYVVWDGIHPTIVGHEIIARQWLGVWREQDELE